MFSRYFNTVRLRAYPRILRERMRDPQAPTPRADRIFIVLGILMHVVWMLLMGVDVMRLRYSPSMPAAIRMLGTGLLLAGKYCACSTLYYTDPPMPAYYCDSLIALSTKCIRSLCGVRGLAAESKCIPSHHYCMSSSSSLGGPVCVCLE